MSDLGEISAELRDALARLERVLVHFRDLDRRRLADLQAELGKRPDGRAAAAMVASARLQLSQAAAAAQVARRAGADWLAQHGSGESGGSGGFSTPGGR